MWCQVPAQTDPYLLRQQLVAILHTCSKRCRGLACKQATAAADLSYAFEHCPRDAEANRARCVYYLVPVKMLLGELPREEVLQRYGLTQYAPIVQVQLL